MATGITCMENLVRFGHFLEICEETDRQTDRKTDRQTKAYLHTDTEIC